MNRKRSGFTLTELIIVVVILGILLTLGIGFIGFGSTSDGIRSGTLQKLSHKGSWGTPKTWEGQLALQGHGGNNPAVLGNVWEFSIDDGEEQVIDILQRVNHLHQLKVYYHEYATNWSWKDTNYRVIGIEVVDGPPGDGIEFGVLYGRRE